MNNKGKQLLSDLKLYSDYLKWNENLNRFETWEEACKDVLQTHYNKYGDKINYLLDEVLPSYQNKEFLTSQRNLQYRSKSIEKNNARLYNCSVMYAYSPDCFNKGFFLLLSGCGLGVNLKQKYVSQFPLIYKKNQETVTFVIPDTIEGWSESIKVLISSYCQHPALYNEYFGKKIRFDYSEIREEGAYISGGFSAPGSKGLKQSLENIETFIEKELINKDSIIFRSYIIYNIFMHISNAVLSGGIRRSAMNIIIDKEDTELLYAKTGNWRESNPHFARSNNSVGMLKYSFPVEEFNELIELNSGDNDIGFVLLESEDQMFNPCVSGTSLINTPQGLYFPKNLQKNEKIILGGKTFNSKPFHQTGVQPTLEIKTDSGRKVKITGNHLIPLGIEQSFVTADSLVIGDTLTVSNNEQSVITIDNSSNDFKKGYLVGSFLGDGNFSRESCQIKFWGDKKEEYHNTCINFINDLDWNYRGRNQTSIQEKAAKYTVLDNKELYNFIKEKDESVLVDKKLTKEILEGSFDYISGLIAGYFDADGTVSFNKIKGNSIRIISSQLENLENIQIGLNSLGIYSTIYNQRNKSFNGVSLLPDGKGGNKLYKVKDSHELVITKGSIKNFYKNVPSINTQKRDKIKTILESYTRPFYKTSYIEKIVEIKQCNSETVWDCEVEKGIEMFDCNGIVVHNCFEIGFDFYNQIKNKNFTVIQLCNLTEGNATAFYTKGKFDKTKYLKICRNLSIVGSLQAGFTSFPYLGKETEEIVAGEALLGCSITGWMNVPELFNADLLKEGVEVIRQANLEVSNLIGTNQAARLTCTKPSGNASVILQTPSGIHPEHSERYFRIMQLNKNSEVARYLENEQPFLLEESVWSATNSDYVVYVPVENPKQAYFKQNLKDIDHLKLINLVQENWVFAGNNQKTAYNPNIHHNVSNTVLIDNKREIVDYIFNNQQFFVAVSFLDRYGDKDFNQAPFTSVLTIDEIVKEYGDGSLLVSGLIVDGLDVFDNNLWEACDYINDRNKKLEGTRKEKLLQKDWLDRARRFAKNYFKGDVKKLVYCLKDIHLYYKWCTVNRELKPIDFSKILKQPSFKKIDEMGAIACAGGSCEI